MTEQPAEVPAEEDVNVKFTAHFRDHGCGVDEVVVTLGDPRMPNILFTFEGDKESNVMKIHLDVTGFSPTDLIDFLEQTAQNMRSVPATEVYADGTRRPARYQQEPGTAEKG